MSETRASRASRACPRRSFACSLSLSPHGACTGLCDCGGGHPCECPCHDPR